LHLLHQAVDSLHDGQAYTAAYKPHADMPEEGCPVLDLGLNWLHKLQQHFVITTLDKLANVFNVVCCKYYVSAVEHNLQTVGNYEAVQPQNGLTSVAQTASLIADSARQLAPYLYDTMLDQSLQDLMTKLPMTKAIGKAHNNPWAMRYIAASNDTGLTVAAKWRIALVCCVLLNLL
jgi:hypothetical protein